MHENRWAHRQEPRHRIVVMDGSYHGDTIGAMSVGARGVFNSAYAPLLFDVASIPFPHVEAEQASLDALEQLCCDSDKPAAFIVEPLILGAGGMKMYSPSVLRQMREICARTDVLFIADEVPANPIACAAALANLEIWRDEPVIDRVQSLAAAQQRQLGEVEGVRNRRRLGTITAFEVDDNQSAYLSSIGPRLLSRFRSRDILLRPLGNTIYVMPPYCISARDLNLVYDAIREAVHDCRCKDLSGEV